jgi:hypothetical protein
VKAYLVSSLSLAAAALAGVVVLCTNDIGPDSLTDEQARSQELDREIAASQLRYEIISHLVEDLANGTLSLASATKQASEQYADDELTLRVAREKFGGDSKNEVACRHLLFRVGVFLKNSPERSHVVMERLEREFRQLYPDTKQPTRYRLNGYESFDHAL